MKKYFVLAVILNIALWLSSCGGLSNRDYCYKIILKHIIPIKYDGIVDSVFTDYADHATWKGVLTAPNLQKKRFSLSFYSEECYSTIHTGDSVIKLADSLFILVYRQGNLIGKFYPSCNGTPEIREIDSATIKRVTKKKWIEINPV